MKARFYPIILALVVIVIVSGCKVVALESDAAATHNDTMRSEEMQYTGITKAVAVMNPTAGNEVTGEVTIEMTDEGLHLMGTLNGLQPGEHGFHFHQWGDCRSDDGKSAGGHFNPEDNMHGHADDKENHVADMPNIVANANGVAVVDAINAKATFDGAKSILGRSIVIHSGPDDYESQPSGASGPRVACGIVGSVVTE